MHISIFWFLLIAAPVSVSAALLACSFLSLKTLKGRVFYNLARGNNLPVYLCITALIFAYAIWENDQLITSLVNSKWTRPLSSERPMGASSIDGGSYW